MIDAVLGGGGLMRIGMFDPTLITSGRLRKVLGEWQCLGGQPIYALYRKSSSRAPKITAFLEFVGESFGAFDPEQITLVHNPAFSDNGRRFRAWSGR
jgi:DNA-binding transcriptional LysR family regulator